MKKLKLFAVALLATFSMGTMAETIFSYTLTSAGTDGSVYDAVGGTAKCIKAMASGGSNEITIGTQTFYKFNSSSAWEFTLAGEGKFAVGDSLSFTCACTTSDKKNKGLKINNAISITGDFPANSTNVIGYVVADNDGIAGTNNFSLDRNDSDIKFGTVEVIREGSVTPSTDPVESVTITGPEAGFAGVEATYKATAAHATAYAWYVNGAVQEDETTATFKYTPNAAGNYAIYATATNEYTDTPVQSNTITLVSAGAISGEIIRATHVNKNTATVTGIIGGSADKNTQADGKLGSNGHYFGIKLATGMFQPDDSVIVVASALNSGNTATFFSDKGTAAIGSADFDTDAQKAVFVLTAQTEWIYLYRETSGCNPTVEYIAVVRPEEDGNPHLAVNNAEVELNVTAEIANPSATVVFSGKNLAAGTYALTVPNVAGLSVEPAAVTVGEDGRLNAAVTLTYASDVDVEAADADLKLTIGELEAAVAVNYSAVHAKAFMTSVNFEQLILDNGLSINRDMLLASANIAFVNIDALDSLNDAKDNRNYPYLGLKLKRTDAKLRGWVAQGSTIKVRFGNIGADFQVAVNGAEQTITAAEYANATVEDAKELIYTAADADAYVEIIGCAKTIVVKQIMINAEIQTVVLPESPETPVALDNIEATEHAVKLVENGQIFILKNGVRYNALGAVVK